MAIKGWSDGETRLPRLGNIALGEKRENGAPKALDYFVVPPEVQEVYGPQPRALDVVLPADDIETIMPSHLKRYGKQFGLICRGDGETATVNENYLKNHAGEYGIKVNHGIYFDPEGEKLSTIQSGGKSWVKIQCRYQNCPHYGKKCREVAILSVILYKVPGVLGVYSLDTGSFNSYQNIKNSIQLLHQMLGRASYIPMKLKVRMQTVNPAVEKEGNLIQIQRQVPVIYLDMGDYTLEKVIQMARERRLTTTAMALPPAPSAEMEPPDEDNKPELLYPEVLDPEEQPVTSPQNETPKNKEPNEEAPQETSQTTNDNNTPNPDTYEVKAAANGSTPAGMPFVRLKLEKDGKSVEALLPGQQNADELRGKHVTLELVKKGTFLVADKLQVVA